MVEILWTNILERCTSISASSPLSIRYLLMINKAFHRLAGKTQIFSTGSHDHAQNRLTHTLTVTSFSRFLARDLNLSELYTEVIALCHDIGHTPFGHAGERVINQVMNGCAGVIPVKDICDDDNLPGYGFKHNLQSAYLCTELEPILRSDGKPDRELSIGKILYGIMSHTDTSWDECELRRRTDCQECVEKKCKLSFYREVRKYIKADNYTFESEIVTIADEVAQRHHDILDAYYMRLMPFDTIYEIVTPIIKQDKNCYNRFKDIKEGQHKAILQLANRLSATYLRNISSESAKNIKELKVQGSVANELQELRRHNPIQMSENISIEDKKLQKKLSTTVLNSHHVQRLDGVADYVIRKLYRAYIENPMQLYDPTIVTVMRRHAGDDDILIDKYQYDIKEAIGIARKDLLDEHTNGNNKFNAILYRAITDHIAGMTDAYAYREYRQLYGHEPPKV